jgi:hypothetical protein
VACDSSGELDGASLIAGVTGQAPRRSFGDLDGTPLITGGCQTGSTSLVWRSQWHIDRRGGLGGTTLIVGATRLVVHYLSGDLDGALKVA